MNEDDFHALLARLRPVIGELADALWLSSLVDPARASDIKAVAQALAAERLGESYMREHILLEPPPGDRADGDHRLGHVVYAGRPAGRFGLRESELTQHVAILGRSGAGKTNVAHLLLDRLMRAGKPFMVLDWRLNYGDLARSPTGRRVLFLRAGEARSVAFNPLDPPAGLGRNQREAHVRDMISVLCTTYLPGHQLLSTRGVEYLLLKAIIDLQAVSPEPVTFNDVRHYIEAYRPQSREGDWKASAANILLKLTTGPIGRLFNPAGGRTLEHLLDEQVILEVDSLGSETDRAGFAKALLIWLFYRRLTEGKSPTSKHVLVIEEAHHCFFRQPYGEQSAPELMLRQMRDLGQAVVLLDQNPSLLSVPALGNTATTICLNLKHADDLEAAGKALTLPRSRWEDIGKLPIGQAIVKVSARHPTPFLVQFPLLALSSDEKAPRGPQGLLRTHSRQPSIREFQAALNEALRALQSGARREEEEGEKKEERIAEGRGRGKEERGVEEERVGARERVLVADIAAHPLSLVTERYERLGWSAHAGTETKRSLLEKRLIGEEKVRVPEGSVTLLALTPAGRATARAQGIGVPALPKNASLEHEYWKKRAAEDYRRRGYHVEEEVPIGDGRAIDLVATKGDERIAIEVETGKSDAEANARKCREAGFERVVTVDVSRRPKPS